jgi:hyaluronan synthase
MWWHKHHPWMTIESVFSGFFPFFIIVTVVSITWSGKLWALIHLLLIIQFIGLLKGFFACLVKQDVLMIFFSLYSCLYITSLLPAKPFAIMTIKKKGWGTSGRNNLLKSYNALIPVSAWMLVVGGGLVYSTILNDYSKEGELYYLTAGIGVYALYWIIMIILWKVIVQKNQKTIEEIKNESIANSNPVASEAVEAESTDLTGNNLDELERGEATKAPEDDFP